MQQLVASQNSSASKRKQTDGGDDATAGATAAKKAREAKGKGGKGGSDGMDDTPWAVRTGDELAIGKGAVTVFLKPTAKAMKVKIDDLCWGMTCTNKTPTEDWWKHMCLGGKGHERFDSPIHKASLEARAAFTKANRAAPGALTKYTRQRPFR